MAGGDVIVKGPSTLARKAPAKKGKRAGGDVIVKGKSKATTSPARKSAKKKKTATRVKY